LHISSPVEHAAAAVKDILRETDGVFMDTASEVSCEDKTSTEPDEMDTESVATDASDDEFAFSSLLGMAKASVDEQAVSRTFFDFGRMIPKMGEWSEHLKTVTTLSRLQDRECAIHFHNELMALCAQLQRLIDTSIALIPGHDDSSSQGHRLPAHSILIGEASVSKNHGPFARKRF
jgi:hypothetical protein